MTRAIAAARTALPPRGRGLIPVRNAVAVLVAACLLLFSPLGLKLEENFGLPLLFMWRGERQLVAPVAIVAFDEETSAALALPDLDQIDRWPRSVHARLIRALSELGVIAIIMDVAFLQRGDADADSALAAAMRAAGNVAILKMLDSASPEATAGNTVEWQLAPDALFADSAAAVGVFTLPDQALKKYTSLFPRTPEGVEGAMPLLALQLYCSEARAALIPALRAIGKASIAGELEREISPALFAARMRAALRENPALAAQLESVAAQSLERNQVPRLRMLLHAYQVPNPIYINFYGPQRAVPTVSLSDVLLHPDSATVAALRGKVIFVGLSERYRKQRDYFFTVYDTDGGGRISGVEVAATLFANMFERSVLQALPPWQQVLLMCAWGGLIVLAARWLTPSRWLLLVSVFAAGYALLAVHLFGQHSLWLPIGVPLGIAAPSLALLALWHYYRDSAQAERAATEALSLYIPADVAALVGRNHLHLLNEHHQIDAICLLTDIVGYTSLSEQREASYMHDLMNRYYRELVAEVERHGGVVANIVGDGLLALWPISDSRSTIGADNDGAAPAQHACAAAMAIVALSDRLSAEQHEPLQTCVGIHCGAVSLGHLGGGRHFEYAPVGDAINTTARVEACNRQLHSRILLSEAVRRWVPHLTLRSHGAVTLKGKREPLGLYELMIDPESR